MKHEQERLMNTRSARNLKLNFLYSLITLKLALRQLRSKRIKAVGNSMIHQI